jgi:hypothetical protein
MNTWDQKRLLEIRKGQSVDTFYLSSKKWSVNPEGEKTYRSCSRSEEKTGFSELEKSGYFRSGNTSKKGFHPHRSHK